MEKVEFLSVLVVCFVFALGALSSYLDKRAVEMGRTDFNRAARLRAGALEEQMSETKLRSCPLCGTQSRMTCGS